jgi:ribosomal protein S18 acetylase RimI-like enzyme
MPPSQWPGRWPRLARVRTDADRREPVPGLTELDRAAFGKDLDALMSVYAAAMHVPAIQLPGRRAIMESHVINPAFRAFVFTTPSGNGRRQKVVAFSYGFRGGRGQWWHDMVRSALLISYGPTTAGEWLDDSFEVAELHVHPDYQQRGLGTSLLYQLTAGRPEHTAVLSTMDSESPARRLYRSLGFVDLLTGYRFSGGNDAYAVMGAALPLSADRRPSPRY